MAVNPMRIGKCVKQLIRKGSMFSHEQEMCHDKMRAPVPRGHFAVYVGEEEKKRFVVPVSYLKHPLFQLLREAQKFGYDHGMGRLTVPCTENYFINLIREVQGSRLEDADC